MQRSLGILALAAALAACGGDAPNAGARRPDAPAPAQADSLVPADSPAAPSAGAEWRSSPAQGPRLTAGDDSTLTVETGPHAVAWPAGATEMAPPYSVEATFHKRTGRLHEGYGIVFGGTALEGGEAEQQYSYFLVRGDGSYLIKRRAGAETPVVRDWTRHPAISRDAGGTGRPNALRVSVGADSTIFSVNGAEVARVENAALAVRGRAGLRISHDLVLDVRGFRVGGPASR